MILIFIDESGDDKFKDYFGLCCAVINANFYGGIKNKFQEILLSAGWDRDIEFKGSCLFSAKRGCANIDIEKRIDIASKVLSLNSSKQNARMRFYYLRKKSDDHKTDYLKFLPALLNKALPRADKRGDKDILFLSCDRREDISVEDIITAVGVLVKNKGYTILENIVMAESNFDTVGILYADIVGYLSARIDNIKNDAELFENIPADQLQNNGKIKKLLSSENLIKLIKKFKRYEVK